MAGPRNHWMSTVRSALLDAIRVNVDISYHGQSAGFASRPQLAEVPAVEANDSCVEAVRIQIVVEHEVDDATPHGAIVAQEECTALACPSASAITEPPANAMPQQPRTRQLMSRRNHAARSLGYGEVHGRVPSIGRRRRQSAKSSMGAD